jgi:CubicO group peptidase (beta-lactamase class C family)
MKTIAARRFRFFAILLAGLLGIWGACLANSQATPASWQWPVSTPEEQGLDSKKLAELVDLIRAGERYPRLHCLLIIRHGYLVVEEYFNKWGPDFIHALQSVSKSFTSALVGIAIARASSREWTRKSWIFSPT